MSTITKQAVQAVADLKAGYTLGHADVAILNELARIALASLEAEAVCVIDQSNLDYLKSGSDADVWPASRAEVGDVLLYRSATPAPVSVPDAMEMDDDFDSAFEHGKAVGWNAYRAAMLQSFGNSEQLNSPVIQNVVLHMVQAQSVFLALKGEMLSERVKDPELGAMGATNIQVWTSKTGGELHFETSNGGCTLTIKPHGDWVACSERMPELPKCWPDMAVIVAHDNEPYGTEALYCRDGAFRWGRDEEPIQDVTHWMPLPAAPKQEVNNDQ